MVHLFVAEDSKLIKRLIRTVIEDYASEVNRLADDNMAVDEFIQQLSKIMFLDIGMPDEKGLKAIFEIIQSNPDAKIDVYRAGTDDIIKKLDKRAIAGPAPHIVIKMNELERIINRGFATASGSITQMLAIDVKFNIIKQDNVKKENIHQFVLSSSLGAFFSITGSIEGGAALMFPLKDILATVGLFQNFTLQEGTTQNVINELGNIFFNAFISVINEELRTKMDLGVPIPINGDALLQLFRSVGKQNDEIVVIKFNFIGKEPIDAYMLLCLGRIVN